MEQEKIVKEVQKITKEYLPSDYQIMLFGSWAKGTASKTSDIDIGILGKEKVPDNLMFKIRQEVEQIPTLRKIDVVDLNLVGEKFRHAALEHAKPL